MEIGTDTAETATEVADWLGPEVLAAVASEPNPAAPPPMPPAPTTTTPAS